MSVNNIINSIPSNTRNLLFINIILFMLQQVMQIYTGRDLFTDTFGLHFFLASDFRLWQLVTYMFLHGSWAHVLLNMFSLWMFGRIIEQTMGTRRFLIYYFICGIGAALCQEMWQFAQYYMEGLQHYTAVTDGVNHISMDAYLNQWVTIGASGACYGILLAFGMTFPNERILLLFPPIPMKAKYFVVGYAVIEAYSAYASNDNVAHFAHLGGMFFGWLYFRYWRRQIIKSHNRYRAWDPYVRTSSRSGILQRIRTSFESMGAAVERFFRSWFGKHDKNDSSRSSTSGGYANIDQAYNARKRAEQQRVDEILDKVRKSGYASLTEEEKNILFNNSQRH